jgi:stage III sporulation protein AA
MTKNAALKSAFRLLPPHLAEMTEKLPQNILQKICEIRLRAGRPFILTLSDGTFTPDKDIIVTAKDIASAAARAYGFSMHSSTVQLCEGYAPYENGCRVGISGTACAEDGNIVNIKNISSLNIRIPREVMGCAESIFIRFMSISPCSLLIAGAPSSGKTTFLRDLARLCGSRYRTSLIDERGELAASVGGVPTNDVGIMTDVFDRYPRKPAVMIAVRVMSPQVIICDEIGSHDDIASLEYAVDSGAALIASCHCGSLAELTVKPNISKLISDGVFRAAVLLKDRCIQDIRTAEELLCLV